MTIFLTGARGFIGQHACRYFADQGRTVVGIGHGAWTETEYRHCGLSDWLNGEIEPANLDAIAARHGAPECIVHLAGGSSVGPSFSAPAEDFRRSVIATSALAEWVRLHTPQTSIVMASSAAVYGAGHFGSIRESATCTPYSPYGFHKYMAELALSSYASSFGLRVACVRLFSVFGPGLRKQLLWDACTKLAQRARTLALGGHGTELRDWLHVEDAAKLLLCATRFANEKCPIVNCGTGIGTSVSAIAQELIARWGGETDLVFSGVARNGDPHSLVADISLARSWGWSPSENWRQGVADYVTWFHSVFQDEKQ